jgi:hypothetical protein
MDETHKGGILIDDYLEILNKTGWYHTHIIPALQPGRRFGHAEKKHPGGYQQVCDHPEPGKSGMMQVQTNTRNRRR